MPPREAPAEPSLRDRLRAETAPEHRALEAALGLLDGHADPARMRALLERFHGFHATWEPALANRLGHTDFLAARSKLALLRDDLSKLGASDLSIDGLARCDAAAELARTQAGALGSLYVLEGSTLGGRLITRHLSTMPWWPTGGLRYFEPYGDQTGRRWRESLEHIEAAPCAQWDEVVVSARNTFALLLSWLVLPSYSRHMDAPA